MVRYMCSLPGIDDPEMEDGTTAFSMALAKGDCGLIKEFIPLKRRRDIDLARYSLIEPKINKDVIQILEAASIKNEGPIAGPSEGRDSQLSVILSFCILHLIAYC